MVARSYTVAFEGVEARIVEVQCAVAAGMPAFAVVGLPDKAVSEARDRVRAALTALSIAERGAAGMAALAAAAGPGKTSQARMTPVTAQAARSISSTAMPCANPADSGTSGPNITSNGSVSATTGASFGCACSR